MQKRMHRLSQDEYRTNHWTLSGIPLALHPRRSVQSLNSQESIRMAKGKEKQGEIMPEHDIKNGDCFIIMPIADCEGYEKGHFSRVYEDIFKSACLGANFNPVRADEVKQTNLIHLDILQKLIDPPMAICDLSSRNPNVLFELGLRQAFYKPTVLVQEVGTPKIFDIAPLRYTEYRKKLKYREVFEDMERSIIESK